MGRTTHVYCACAANHALIKFRAATVDPTITLGYNRPFAKTEAIYRSTHENISRSRSG